MSQIQQIQRQIQSQNTMRTRRSTTIRTMSRTSIGISLTTTSMWTLLLVALLGCHLIVVSQAHGRASMASSILRANNNKGVNAIHHIHSIAIHPLNLFTRLPRLPRRKQSLPVDSLSTTHHAISTDTTTTTIHSNQHNGDNDDIVDDDEASPIRSLALNSRDEQAFFTQTDNALLQLRNSKTPITAPTGQELECSTSKTARIATTTMASQLKAKQQLLLPSAAAATTATTAMTTNRPLLFWENMVCGAISRSMAQTIMHPANTMKTILQNERVPPSLATLLRPSNFRRLSRGAGANFLLSVPHGAVNFAVLELVRTKLNTIVQTLGLDTDRIGPGLDFCSSAISTICCSIVSTPQMMITDNIMAGNYPNLPKAVQGLYSSQGINGFYAGWFPGLAGKIPSYALTWTLFQQLKAAHRRAFQRDPKDIENSILGCLASATTVCIMIPIDTVKTRLVTQASMATANPPYRGIVDCALRVYREEGLMTFYRGLPPRLVSVVPMIGIQFGVYEFMKRVMQERSSNQKLSQTTLQQQQQQLESSYLYEEAPDATFQEAAMEVAANTTQPFPAPHFQVYKSQERGSKTKSNNSNKKK